MSTDVGGKQKSKRQIISNWPGRRKKEKLKTEKKYTCQTSECWKKIWKKKKKEKRRTRKCVWKKMEKEENEGRYEQVFLFSLTFGF